MALWEQLLIAFGGQATLLTVLAFLFRSLIGQLLTKDLEKYKMELKARADASIKQLRSAFQLTAIEHQTRFSKLHEKRAQVVADLYEKFFRTKPTGSEYNLRKSNLLFKALDRVYAST